MNGLAKYSVFLNWNSIQLYKGMNLDACMSDLRNVLEEMIGSAHKMLLGLAASPVGVPKV